MSSLLGPGTVQALCSPGHIAVLQHHLVLWDGEARHPKAPLESYGSTVGTGCGCPVSVGCAAKAAPPANPNRLLVIGMNRRHRVFAGAGQPELSPCTLALCQGVSCKDSGKHQGVQTFQFPEPNVSGLSCWFCYLFPWKSGLCTLLQPLLLLYQPGDPGSAIPSPPGSSHHSCGFLLHPQRFLGVHLP